MCRALALCLLLGACVSPAQAPTVRVTAAREPEGIRVRFRRLRAGAADVLARLEADGGSIDEVLHSPDHRTVSCLWRDPRGEIRCAFPFGGVGEFRAGDAPDPGRLDYVLLAGDDVLVTMQLPRGCPMRPRLTLRVEGVRTARLRLPGGRVVPVAGGGEATWTLPTDDRGVLVGADHELRLETADGAARTILIGIDPDGTPAALSGYLKNW